MDTTITRTRLVSGEAGEEPARIVLDSEALASTDPTLKFIGHGLSWLTRYFPSERAIFYPVDQRLGKFGRSLIVVRAFAGDVPRIRWSISRYRQNYYACDPFAPRRFAGTSHGVVDVRDVADSATFARSTYAREYLNGLDMREQTTLFLRTQGRIAAGIDLFRAGAADDAQLAFLRTTHAFLEHAYACAVGATTAVDVDGARTREPLTRREAEVARLVACGASNSEVARALSITEGTVKTHLVHVFAKLTVRSRTQLAVLLNSQGGDDDLHPLLSVADDPAPA